MCYLLKGILLFPSGFVLSGAPVTLLKGTMVGDEKVLRQEENLVIRAGIISRARERGD